MPPDANRSASTNPRLNNRGALFSWQVAATSTPAIHTGPRDLRRSAGGPSHNPLTARECLSQCSESNDDARFVQFGGIALGVVGENADDLSEGTSTTLADLFTLLFCSHPSSAVRATLRWRLSEERDDGVTHGWQARLRRWSVGSFFPASLF